MIQHNLDVMHVENIVFDNVFNIITNIQGRTKDNAKSRAGLVEMSIRLELHPDGVTSRFSKAIYTLDKNSRQVFSNGLKMLNFLMVIYRKSKMV